MPEPQIGLLGSRVMTGADAEPRYLRFPPWSQGGSPERAGNFTFSRAGRRLAEVWGRDGDGWGAGVASRRAAASCLSSILGVRGGGSVVNWVELVAASGVAPCLSA